MNPNVLPIDSVLTETVDWNDMWPASRALPDDPRLDRLGMGGEGCASFSDESKVANSGAGAGVVAPPAGAGIGAACRSPRIVPPRKPRPGDLSEPSTAREPRLPAASRLERDGHAAVVEGALMPGYGRVFGGTGGAPSG